MELILAPGFSTAKNVTGVSGRGVGMDVVKRAIDALRGTIEISSTPGKGTTITLKLPLTLAIIDGFLTKIGGRAFHLPAFAGAGMHRTLARGRVGEPRQAPGERARAASCPISGCGSISWSRENGRSSSRS